MSLYHSLHEKEINIECNGKALERVNVTKLLPECLPGLTLGLEEHVTKLLSSCYVVLAALRKMRDLAPFKLRKLLVERLILS